uniref:Uncharacterized protein n=1 Tax=Anopheles culicifacies TaxID=139723 RepID=A0A182MGE4_9DIPT
MHCSKGTIVGEDSPLILINFTHQPFGDETNYAYFPPASVLSVNTINGPPGASSTIRRGGRSSTKRNNKNHAPNCSIIFALWQHNAPTPSHYTDNVTRDDTSMRLVRTNQRALPWD